MPPAVAAVAAVVASIGIGAATATAIGTIVVYGALSLGASYLAAVLTPKPKTTATTADPSDGQQVVRQSNPERTQGYGRIKVGGSLFFYDSREGKFYLGIMHCMGPIDGFEEYWLGDDLVTLDSDGYVIDEKYQHEGESKVRIVSHLGGEDQAADSILMENWNDIWTQDHQLRGIAYSVMVLDEVPNETYSSMFGSGVPALRVVLRATKVLDPRDMTQPKSWSDNSVRVLLDYLISTDGMKFDVDNLELDSWAAAADICDEWVVLKNGNTERRYRAWGLHKKFSHDPKDVMDWIKATCGADLYETPEGKLAVKVGRFQQPETTINDELGHIVSYNVKPGTGVLNLFNYLKIQYTSPDHDYQLVDGEVWRDEVNINSRGGEILEESAVFYYVPSHSQARRLAKIATIKANPSWSGTVITNLYGLKLVGESMFNLIVSELDINSTFGLSSLRMFGGTSCEVQLTALTDDIDAWDPDTEEGDPPALPDPADEDDVLEPPTNFVVVFGTRVVGSTTGQILSFTWTNDFRPSFSFQIRYKQTTSSIWQYMTSGIGDSTAISEIIESGQNYICQIRTVTSGGAVSDWSSEVTINA